MYISGGVLGRKCPKVIQSMPGMSTIEFVYIQVYISGSVLGRTCLKVYKVCTDNLGCLLLSLYIYIIYVYVYQAVSLVVRTHPKVYKVCTDNLGCLLSSQHQVITKTKAHRAHTPCAS